MDSFSRRRSTRRTTVAAGRMTSEAGCRPVPAGHEVRFEGVPARTPGARGVARTAERRSEGPSNARRRSPVGTRRGGAGEAARQRAAAAGGHYGRGFSRSPVVVSAWFSSFGAAGRADRDLPKPTILHQRSRTSPPPLRHHSATTAGRGGSDRCRVALGPAGRWQLTPGSKTVVRLLTRRWTGMRPSQRAAGSGTSAGYADAVRRRAARQGRAAACRPRAERPREPAGGADSVSVSR